MWFVIGVETDAVTITYTDVHHARAKFFADLLRNFPIQWNGLTHTSAAKLHDEEAFYLVTGRFAFHDVEARDHFLEETRRLARLPDRLEQGAENSA